MYTIVFVCTANRFRSPLAEAFVRRLVVGLPVTVESFGAVDFGEVPPLPQALEIGNACGVNLSRHRTRELSEGVLEDVDLLVGFDHSHVRSAVVNAHAAREHAFTFREIVRLLTEIAPDEEDAITRARSAVRRAAELRRASPEASTSDDIADPVGRSRKVYLETAAEVRELSLELVTALFGVSSPTGLAPVPARLTSSPFRLWRR